jgi:hypothetical protein
MKALISLFSLVVAVAPTLAQEAIRPFVAPEFGKPVMVRAEFVPKSNTYYDQNIVSEPYTLKVVAVGGRELKEPVLIEYRLDAEKKTRVQIERPGTIQNFEAYESLFQPAMATPWLPEGEQGQSFALIHILYVRVPQKKG